MAHGDDATERRIPAIARQAFADTYAERHTSASSSSKLGNVSSRSIGADASLRANAAIDSSITPSVRFEMEATSTLTWGHSSITPSAR